MSSGSPESAAQRNGPLPSQNSGRMYSGTKPGMSNASLTPACSRLRADVVAVVERRPRRGACSASIARTCVGHRRHRSRDVVLRIAIAQGRGGLGERQAVRHVAVQRVVRGGLVGQHVGRDAAGDERRQHVGGVAREADRARRRRRASSAVSASSASSSDCRRLVEIPGREPPRDARGSTSTTSAARAVHRGGQRLGAAHAAEAGGDDRAGRRSEPPKWRRASAASVS